jgi:cytochrome c peroxidase
LATDATTSERVEELKTTGREIEESTKAALHLKRKPEDYQKVYNKIAEKLEADDYDGESRCASVRILLTDL